MAHKTKKKTLNQMFSKTAANYDFMDFSFIPIRKERRIHSYNWEGRKEKKNMFKAREREKNFNSAKETYCKTAQQS